MAFLERTLRARAFGPVAGLLILSLVFEAISGQFFTEQQLASVAGIAAAIGTIAVGVAFLMIVGEFDLSVGAVYAFAPIVAGKLMIDNGWSELEAVLLVVAIGLVVGLVHGLVTTVLGIPSFITTLGTLFIFTGANFVITGGYPVEHFDNGPVFNVVGGPLGSGGFSLTIVWMLVIGAFAWFILNKTQLGNWAFAAGGRRGVARELGVPERGVKTFAFCLCSICAALAGLAQLAQLGSISAGFGQDYNLLAIVAAVLGGTSLFGVIGSIGGTLVGAVLLASLQTGLVLSGAPGSWYTSLIGVLLIVAVLINTRLEGVRFRVIVDRRPARADQPTAP